LELKSYDQAINYGLEFESENESTKGEVRLLTIKAAYEQTNLNLGPKEELLAIDKAGGIYEGFMQKGWEGKEQKKAFEMYSKLVKRKEKLTDKQK
jgi:hypothetical protein